MSAGEYRVTEIDDVPGLFKWVVSRHNGISLTALVGAGGTVNSSLVPFTTGAKRTADLNMVPVLRTLRVVGYGFEARPTNGKGVQFEPPGSVPMMAVGPDGGPLKVWIEDTPGIALLLNTLAAANGMTVSGLMRLNGTTGTSLVSLASGRTPNKDVRMRGLLQIVAKAGYELVARPMHRSAQAARMAFAAGNR